MVKPGFNYGFNVKSTQCENTIKFITSLMLKQNSLFYVSISSIGSRSSLVGSVLAY